MILKGNMQALVAQQPKSNQILHHQKNNLNSSVNASGNSKQFLNSTVKVENENHKRMLSGGLAYKKTDDSVQ